MTTTHTFYLGHVLDVLKTLPDESVQSVVTSVPYWGLRAYGTQPQVWGGDPVCEHDWQDWTYVRRSNDEGPGQKQRTNIGAIGRDEPVRNAICSKCAAWLGELGLEPTPDLYVSHLVEVFREARRVLRSDGTLWLDLGDSYAAAGGHTRSGATAMVGNTKRGLANLGTTTVPRGLKAKDLCGIPWRVAFALQADGWWLRRDIVWNKLNPMPESCTDRPTASHEFVFLLTKSGAPLFWTHPERDGVRKKPRPDYAWVHKVTGEIRREEPPDPENWRRKNLWEGHDYFYDATAIQEAQVCPQDSTPDDVARALNRRRLTQIDPRQDMIEPFREHHGRTGRNAFRGQGANREGKNGPANRDGRDMKDIGAAATRNKRDVWTIATQPWPGSHFAVFPEALVEPCILAGTSEKGCCPKCGAPWARVTSKRKVGSVYNQQGPRTGEHTEKTLEEGRGKFATRYEVATDTLGWRPTCSCGLPPMPCVVLDPFGGSGTVNVVAQRYGRSSIYGDLKAEYRQMAVDRMRPAQPSLVQPYEIVLKEIAS